MLVSLTILVKTLQAKVTCLSDQKDNTVLRKKRQSVGPVHY